MHLVNTKTIELEYFGGGKVPPYAILSHCWGKDELNFKEVSKKRVDEQKRGYVKMAAACALAQGDFGLDYLWIDTCCIDKRSSAELSEAINSMYRWYQNADVCIAYLHDVKRVESPTSFRTTYADPNLNSSLDDAQVPFEQSRWFSRAWTLQELLAPAKVHFYNRAWKFLGTKGLMLDRLETATGIPPPALIGKMKLAEFVIAERMRWASRRCATREEDLAYSLLGIFNVNMPMLYGEGEKAFVRLQEEIIKQISDPTLLFWGIGSGSTQLLASSPADFARSKSIRSSCFNHKPVSLNNVGLSIELELMFWDWETYGVEYICYGVGQCVLLLRMDSETRCLYRLSTLESRGDQRPEWQGAERRWRRVTIQRGSMFDNRFLTPAQPTFRGIRIDKCSWPVQPLHQPGSPSQRLGIWEVDHASRRPQCRFKHPSSQVTARMVCEIKAWHICIDFCIDFDFIPYLYVVPHHKPPEVLQISEMDRLYDVTAIKDWDDLKWKNDGTAAAQSAVVDKSDAAGYLKGWICRPITQRYNTEGCNEISLRLPIDLVRTDGVCINLVPPLHPKFASSNPCWVFSLYSINDHPFQFD